MNAVTIYWINTFIYILNVDFFFPSSATEHAAKVPYQARMCVKDSFVKCWQQPQKPLPSLSSPPTGPGGRQKILWYGLGLALCHLPWGDAGCTAAVPKGAAWLRTALPNACETVVSDTVNTPAENMPHNCSNNTWDGAERTHAVRSLPR